MEKMSILLTIILFASLVGAAEKQNPDPNFIVELKQKAEQGDANSQCNLGFCYYKGNGVEQDYKQAVYWYRKAAEQGIGRAQYNLGVCYYRGLGVAEDHIEAYKWILLAEEKGEDVSKLKKPLQNKLSLDEVEEAQRRAKEFFKQQAANKENQR